MTFAYKYVALYVDDLRAAEAFYRRVFGMELLFRESEAEGLWRTLRPELDWDDADEHGINVGMVVLRRDAFVLPLFRGSARPGAVKEICIAMPPEELEGVRARLPDDITAEGSGQSLAFDDPFGFQWTLHQAGRPFRSSGEIADRWL